MSLDVSSSLYRGLGNGGKWAVNAVSKNLRVDGTPSGGSVGVDIHAAGGYGHVVFVEDVDGPVIEISEYNWSNPGSYGQRLGTPSQLGVDYFIHFEDHYTTSLIGQATSFSPSALGSASNADGRLTIFALGNDNKVYAKTQQEQNQNLWGGWYYIPGGGKGITATTNTDGRIQVFYVGGDGAVYYRLQERPNVDRWLAERRIHAGLGGPISVTRNQDGRLALFAVGTDNKIYAKMQSQPSSESWNGWYEIPAGAKSIAASTNADGRIEIMYVGGDGAVWSRRQRYANGNTWYSEKRIHAGLHGHIALTRQADLRLQLFARGTDNKVYENTQSSPSNWDWHGWSMLPAGAHSVDANTYADGRIFVMYVGGDGALYYRHQRVPDGDTWTSEGRMHAGLLM